MHDTPDAWEVLRRERVYDGTPFVTVERQTVRLPDGRIVEDYHQVTLPDFAIAVPVLTDGRIITLWQYKHGARCVSLTFPAGHVEPGEDPEYAIRRELMEETGYRASRAMCLGSYVTNGNQRCNVMHLFVLTGCEQAAMPQHDDLEAWDLRLMTGAEIEKALQNGRLAMLPQLTAWLAYRSGWTRDKG
jgi:ADP-ribose pyrophosphatase